MTKTDRLDMMASIRKGVPWSSGSSLSTVSSDTFNISPYAMAVFSDGFYLAAFPYNARPAPFSTLVGCMWLYSNIPRRPLVRAKLSAVLEEFAPSVKLTPASNGGGWCLNGTYWPASFNAIVVFDAAANDDRAQSTATKLQLQLCAYGHQCLTFSTRQPAGMAWIPPGPMTMAAIGAHAGVT
jgi:hypothetical protein